MRLFRMEYRSGGKVNRIDRRLNIQQVFQATAYTPAEMERITLMKLGDELFIGPSQDIYIACVSPSLDAIRNELMVQLFKAGAVWEGRPSRHPDNFDFYDYLTVPVDRRVEVDQVLKDYGTHGIDFKREAFGDRNPDVDGWLSNQITGVWIL